MIARDLKQIEALANERRYEEALAKCEELLQEFPTEKIAIVGARARILARAGEYVQAVRDCTIVLETGEGTIRDYYRAADYALSTRQFAEAVTWFREVLRLGEEQNEAWFKSSSYFLLAYAYMELDQYQEAITNLDNAVEVEADVAMPVPFMCGMCSHQQLRQEIKRRAK